MSMPSPLPLVSRVSTRPESVLVVEGNSQIGNELARELRLIYGPLILIQQASSDSQALRLLGQTKFDLVLVDYHLHGADALELLSEILGCVEHTAVVLMTDRPNDRVAAAAMREGAADYFVKGDLGPAEFEQLITQALRTARVERENTRIVEQLRRDQGRRGEEIRALSRHMHARLARLRRLLRPVASPTTTSTAQPQTGSYASVAAELRHLEQLLDNLSRMAEVDQGDAMAPACNKPR